jgi:hypothetical protein
MGVYTIEQNCINPSLITVREEKGECIMSVFQQLSKNIKNAIFHLKCVLSRLNSNGRMNDFAIVELCVFMLTNLLRSEGVVREREGSSMLPYSCSLPKTTDSLSYSES